MADNRERELDALEQIMTAADDAANHYEDDGPYSFATRDAAAAILAAGWKLMPVVPAPCDVHYPVPRSARYPMEGTDAIAQCSCKG